MKKFLALLLSVVFAVCLCMPLAACGDEQPEVIKRIIGIDSDKTYLKAVSHLAHRRDLIDKEIWFEFYSYDEVKADELQSVNLDYTTDTREVELSVRKYELSDRGVNEKYGCHNYLVKLTLYMEWIVYDLRIESITLKIAGKDYKFSSDIYYIMDTFRSVFVEPDGFGFNQYSSGRTEPYGQLIGTRYDMTLKSIKFQTEGFEILSYNIEYYNISQDHTIVKLGDKLPFMLKAKEKYQIFIEAIPPQDCLYYAYDLEAVVEISGVEMTYNNVDGLHTILHFKGSALNALEKN